MKIVEQPYPSQCHSSRSVCFPLSRTPLPPCCTSGGPPPASRRRRLGRRSEAGQPLPYRAAGGETKSDLSLLIIATLFCISIIWFHKRVFIFIFHYTDYYHYYSFVSLFSTVIIIIVRSYTFMFSEVFTHRAGLKTCADEQ